MRSEALFVFVWIINLLPPYKIGGIEGAAAVYWN